MQKLSHILVKHRITFFALSVCLALILALFISDVNINKDLSKYLDPDSNMAKGLSIMNDEFETTLVNDSFQIMFTDLSEDEKEQIYVELTKYEGVESVDYDKTDAHNSKAHTMYVVNTKYYMDDDNVGKIIDQMKATYGDRYEVQTFYPNGYMEVLDLLIPMAVILMLIVLFSMCKAYIEPVLILCSIAIAILINMGSNIIFESVSDMTFAIAAVLQLVLSIDYSIMLIHRFIQEDELSGHSQPELAMEKAVNHAFSAISSSAITTIVGLLVLTLMSFTIGKDIGLVLAKGIILSFVCAFTVLPTLILWGHRLLLYTNKTYLANKKTKGGEVNAA
jgi:predicted RND superfamily exporter protein